MCVCVCVVFARSVVSDSLVAHQAPRFLGFSRQEYWNGLPFSSPYDVHGGYQSIVSQLHIHALVHLLWVISSIFSFTVSMLLSCVGRGRWRKAERGCFKWFFGGFCTCLTVCQGAGVWNTEGRSAPSVHQNTQPLVTTRSSAAVFVPGLHLTVDELCLWLLPSLGLNPVLPWGWGAGNLWKEVCPYLATFALGKGRCTLQSTL